MSDGPRSQVLTVATMAGVAVVTAVMAWLVLDPGDDGDAPVAPGATAPVPTPVPSPEGSTKPSAEPTTPSTERIEPPKPPRKRYATPEQLQRHAETRQRIQQALGRERGNDQGEPERPPRPTRGDAKGTIIDGALDKDYVRAAIREDLIPLAQECYSSVLETDPHFAGRIVLEFYVMGDEEVGGIVDDAQAGEGTTMTNPDFIECMSESMMTVMMDPPADGGIAHVSYPLTFEIVED